MEILGWVGLAAFLLAGVAAVAYLVTRDSLSSINPDNFHDRGSDREPLAPNFDPEFRTGQPIPGLPLVDLMRIDHQLKKQKRPKKS